MQRVLLMSVTGIRVYYVDGGTLVEGPSFETQGAVLADLDGYLAETPDIPTRIVTDLTGEEFRIETLPLARGRDRIALYRRHARRLFPATPYRQVSPIERLAGPPRRQRVLVSAITSADHLDMWLDAMAHHRVPLLGIHSAPLLIGRLLRRMQLHKGNCLVVSDNGQAGMRQSLFLNGALEFSRLSPAPPETDPGACAAYVRDEIEKTRRFLANLRLLERDRPLRVVFICSAARWRRVGPHFRQTSLADYECWPAEDVARLHGLRATVDDMDPGKLFALLVTGCRVPNHYARAAHRRWWRLRRLRRGLGMATAALVLVTVGLTAALWQDSRGLAEHNRLLQQRITALGQRADRLEAAVRAWPVPAASVAAANEAAGYILDHRRTPDSALAQAGRTLVSYPELRLEALHWQGGGVGTATAAAADDDMQQDPGAGGPIPAAPGTARPHSQPNLVLEGHLADFDGNYPAAHARLHAFMEALRHRPGIVQVTALRMPLQTDPDNALHGSLGQRRQTPRAPFSIRLVIGEDGHAS